MSEVRLTVVGTGVFGVRGFAELNFASIIVSWLAQIDDVLT
jgi:hypothetical protein